MVGLQWDLRYFAEKAAEYVVGPHLEEHGYGNVKGMAHFYALLVKQGGSPDEWRIMAQANPARLLG